VSWLSVGIRRQRRAVSLPSKPDIPPCYLQECHIGARCIKLGFVGPIQQVVVGKACNTRLDFGKAFDRAIAAIGEPLLFYLKHTQSYHEGLGGGELSRMGF
jgi:hypothetical protein